MSELERSLTNIDWLIRCSPIKSKSADTLPLCGKCVFCSRARSRRKSAVPSTESAVRSDVTPPDVKPPHSYVHIITEAIMCSTNQRLTLSELYQHIMSQYPYFSSASVGWKNSVRHNLSLNKIFRKVPRQEGDKGKGCYWEVDKGAIKSLKTQSRSAKRRRSPVTADKEREQEIPGPWAYMPFQYSCCQGLPSPPPVCPSPQEFAPFLPDTRCQLNDSFRTFCRSMLEAQRQEDFSEEPATKRHKLDLPSQGAEELSEMDLSTFQQLVSSLNPADRQREQLYTDLRESFNHFLRELSTTATKNRLLEPSLPEDFSSNEPSSQEFDWNAIL